MILEKKPKEKSDIRRSRKGTHNYNNRSKVNHVTPFKNKPLMFKRETKDTSTAHIGSDYIDHTEPKTNKSHWNQYHTTLPVKPLEKSYIELVKMDAPVWTNSICKKLRRLYNGLKSHAGTDTIEFIFHKDKPRGRKATYARDVCNIRPPKTETRRTRLTAGGNMIDHPVEVSTPT